MQMYDLLKSPGMCIFLFIFAFSKFSRRTTKLHEKRHFARVFEKWGHVPPVPTSPFPWSMVSKHGFCICFILGSSLNSQQIVALRKIGMQVRDHTVGLRNCALTLVIKQKCSKSLAFSQAIFLLQQIQDLLTLASEISCLSEKHKPS